MPRTGRPTDLTPEVQEAICKAVRAGNFPSAAAQSAGISRGTYFIWMKKGRAEKAGIFRNFVDAVKTAERQSEVALVAIWRKHTAKNWQAAAALLERRFPKRWLRPQHVQVAATLKVEDARDLLLAKLDRLAGVAEPSDVRDGTPALHSPAIQHVLCQVQRVRQEPTSSENVRAGAFDEMQRETP